MKKMKNSILLLLTLSLIVTATANLSPVYAIPTLSVQPYATFGSAYQPGTWFTVDVTVASVSGLFGVEFKLAYLPTIVEATKITGPGSVGTFFPEPIGTPPDDPVGPTVIWHNEINNTLGYVWLAVTFGTTSSYPYGRSGSGPFLVATINFTVTGIGGTVLGLLDTELANYEGNTIDHAAGFGLFNNLKEAPVAIFTASRLDPQIGETVAFSATASYDPDGTIVKYYWDFGDGTKGESLDNHLAPTPHTEHEYAYVGTYTVRLTVTDNDGAQGRAQVTIQVTPPRGLKADIVDAWPEFRNIRAPPWPEEEYWWRKDTHFNPLYADVVNLASGSVTVKVKFTVTRDGVKVATFTTDPYEFAEGTYLDEHRFNTATDCRPAQYETNFVKGSYVVTATALYQVDRTWVEGRTRTFKFRVI